MHGTGSGHSTCPVRFMRRQQTDLVNPSCLLAVGYGDVTPTNDIERVYAVCLALAGALVFAFCIGSISSLASQGNKTEQIIEERVHGLTDFLRFSSVPRMLQYKLRMQLFHCSKRAPHLIHDVLDLMPRNLKNDLIDHLMADTGGNLKIFQFMDEDCRCLCTQNVSVSRVVCSRLRTWVRGCACLLVCVRALAHKCLCFPLDDFMAVTLKTTHDLMGRS